MEHMYKYCPTHKNKTTLEISFSSLTQNGNLNGTVFTFPRPAPIIALVGVNISGMPGPPLGPSPLMTTTFPFKTNPGKKLTIREVNNKNISYY